jgi:hypothetical protein
VKRFVLDTNLYIDWINAGLREALLVGSGYTRLLSTVLRSGEVGHGPTESEVRGIDVCDEIEHLVRR